MGAGDCRLAAAQWLERQKNLLLLRQLSILVQQNPDDPEHGPYVNRNRSNLLAQSFTTLLNRVFALAFECTSMTNFSFAPMCDCTVCYCVSRFRSETCF